MAAGAPGFGAALVGAGAVDPVAVDEPAGGVEPPTSSTEPATDSRLVPTHQATAITTARARTETPTTANRRRVPGSSMSVLPMSVLPVSGYPVSGYPSSGYPSSGWSSSK